MHIYLFLNVFKRSCNFHVNSLSKFDKQSSYRYMITKCMLSSTSHSNNIIVVLTSSLALKVKYLGKFLECHTTKVTRRTSCLNSFCFCWRNEIKLKQCKSIHQLFWSIIKAVSKAFKFVCISNYITAIATKV